MLYSMRGSFPYDIQKNDGVTQTKTAPMVGKASCFRVCGLVDVVGHLEVHEQTGERWIRLAPSSQYITKCQFKGLNMSGEKADLQDLIKKIKEFDYSREEK